jgi:hypothetical protein
MTSDEPLYVTLTSCGPGNVTLGLTLWVRTSVTEVTFGLITLEVQFGGGAPKSEQERFPRTRVLMEMATCRESSESGKSSRCLLGVLDS